MLVTAVQEYGLVQPETGLSVADDDDGEGCEVIRLTAQVVTGQSDVEVTLLTCVRDIPGSDPSHCPGRCSLSSLCICL